MSRTRWGIVSCGCISQDFTTALLMEPREHEVVAIAARNLKQAEEFAQRFNIPRAYGSYEEMAKDKNIDVVYVGSITSTHCKTSRVMLENGLSVLCEKPLTLSLKDTTTLVELARSKGLFFMEGYWCRFFPVYHQLRKELENNSIGEVKAMTVNMGIASLHCGRVTQKDMGGGALMDVGGYAIQMAQLVMKDYPTKVVALGHMQETGVDLCDTVTLLYSDKRMASLNLHVGVNMKSGTVIYGTEGFLEVPDLNWCPQELYTPTKKHFFSLPKCDRPMVYQNCEGFVYEQKAVRECLLAGKTESPLMTWAQTVDIARITADAMSQLGFSYNTEES